MKPWNKGIRKDVAERFWSKADKSGDCWIWTAGKSGCGYGMFELEERRPMKAHRMAWILTNGPLRKGLVVMHSCDRKLCVNPDHLVVGTPRQNTQDAAAKGLMPRGERNGNSRYTEDFVRDLRKQAARGISGYRLSKQLGIDRSVIDRIINRQSWRHVE